MKTKLLIVAAALAAAAAAWAQDDALRRYSASAPVTLTSAEGLQRLELPLPVLQASRAPGYADVRLFDAGGTPLPQAWAGAPAAAEPERRTQAVPRFAWPQRASNAASESATRVQINAAGAVVRIFGATAAPNAPTDPQRWLLDLSALPRPDGARWERIALDWPRRAGGLSTTVRVEASDDTQQWRFVTQAVLLELDDDAQAPAHKHIDWPASAGRPKYLRLSVDAPLALTRSELVVSSEAPAAALASQRFPFAADADPATRAWTLDALGALPVVRLQVHLPTPNSVLALRLEQRHDNKAPWQMVASFVAWRLVREGQESVAPPLALTAPPARHWRLVADARTPLPTLDSLDATLEWRSPLLVFAAGAAPGLKLAVGRDKAGASALALATLMPGWRSGDEFKLPLASVGALSVQPSVTPGLPERFAEATDEDRRRWGLWGALALAVAGLAWLAARLARDVNSKTP
jgi:Protein of unknown function (DUF3999)